MARTDLTEKQWRVFEPHLPANPKRGHVYVEHCRVINGVVWRLKTGAPWRDIPERYGPRSSPLGLRLEPFTEGKHAGTGSRDGSEMAHGRGSCRRSKPTLTPKAISIGTELRLGQNSTSRACPPWTAAISKPTAVLQAQDINLPRVKKGGSRRRVAGAFPGWSYQ